MTKKTRALDLPGLIADLRICLEKIEKDGRIDPVMRNRAMRILTDLPNGVDRLRNDAAALIECSSQVFERYGLGGGSGCSSGTPCCSSLTKF
jgi:hypothetical protein